MSATTSPARSPRSSTLSCDAASTSSTITAVLPRSRWRPSRRAACPHAARAVHDVDPAFYARHGHKAGLVGISRAQLASAPAGLEAVGVISNPIDVGAWPLREHEDDYLLWVGRMTAEKGPHRAIAARAARV